MSEEAAQSDRVFERLQVQHRQIIADAERNPRL
jgi:hypothetical protein